MDLFSSLVNLPTPQKDPVTRCGEATVTLTHFSKHQEQFQSILNEVASQLEFSLSDLRRKKEEWQSNTSPILAPFIELAPVQGTSQPADSIATRRSLFLDPNGGDSSNQDRLNSQTRYQSPVHKTTTSIKNKPCSRSPPTVERSRNSDLTHSQYRSPVSWASDSSGSCGPTWRNSEIKGPRIAAGAYSRSPAAAGASNSRGDRVSGQPVSNSRSARHSAGSAGSSGPLEYSMGSLDSDAEWERNEVVGGLLSDLEHTLEWMQSQLEDLRAMNVQLLADSRIGTHPGWRGPGGAFREPSVGAESRTSTYTECTTECVSEAAQTSPLAIHRDSTEVSRSTVSAISGQKYVATPVSSSESQKRLPGSHSRSAGTQRGPVKGGDEVTGSRRELHVPAFARKKSLMLTPSAHSSKLLWIVIIAIGLAAALVFIFKSAAMNLYFIDIWSHDLSTLVRRVVDMAASWYGRVSLPIPSHASLQQTSVELPTMLTIHMVAAHSMTQSLVVSFRAVLLECAANAISIIKTSPEVCDTKESKVSTPSVSCQVTGNSESVATDSGASSTVEVVNSVVDITTNTHAQCRDYCAQYRQYAAEWREYVARDEGFWRAR